MRGWKKLKRKSVHVVLDRSSAEKIVKEWYELDVRGSIHVRSLIRRIEKHLGGLDE